MTPGALDGGFDWTAVSAEARDFLMPEIILTLFGCLALALSVVLPHRHQRWVAGTSAAGAVLSAASLAVMAGVQGAAPHIAFSGLYIVDAFALVVKAVVLLALVLSIGLSVRYLDDEGEQRGEFYALMVFAALGMSLLASGYDLLVLYVSLELMALSVYILVGSLRRSQASSEAAMKYFLLGLFSSGILLYGMSLLYGVTGTTSVGQTGLRLAEIVSGPGASSVGPLLAISMVMIAVGVLFKVAAVPFHMWAPDAYEGAPTPVAAFMSVGVKVASFALAARLFLDALPALRASEQGPGWGALLGAVAALTMTVGNAAAVTQDNTKRMLAFSSIAHAGYLLLGLVAGNETGYIGFTLSLVVYAAMTLGAWGVLIAVRRTGEGGEVEGGRFEDFAGLARRAPALAVLMTIFMLSLGGLPPTAGFVAKFYLFYGLVQAGVGWMTVLAAIAVANTAVSAYYYFRIVKAMYAEEPLEGAPRHATSAALWAAVAVAAALTVLPGLYPQPAVEVSRRAIERFPTARRPEPARPPRENR